MFMCAYGWFWCGRIRVELFMCAAIFKQLKREPAAVCGMTVDTGLDTTVYDAASTAIIGAKATLHCEGNPPAYSSTWPCR